MTATTARERTSAIQGGGFCHSLLNTSVAVNVDLEEPLPAVGGHKVARDYTKWVCRGTSVGGVASSPAKHHYLDTEELFQDYIDLDDWECAVDRGLAHAIFAAPERTVSAPHDFLLGDYVIFGSIVVSETRNLHHHVPVERQAVEQVDAAHLVENIKRVSGLTLEEIAPLAGVSRRSLQHWLRGDPISARKENRLRDLSIAIDEIAAETEEPLRPVLMARAPNGLSAYDLLASGRFQTAKAVATGERPELKGETRQASVPHPFATLKEQLSLIEDGVPDRSPRKLVRRLSGRIKR
ncbi:MAG: hypothetical protein V2I43_26290 [Parvularcula sp.]|jgi:hypothetical protein|nr:hypothetical protein [Parvularcula sp.]